MYGAFASRKPATRFEKHGTNDLGKLVGLQERQAAEHPAGREKEGQRLPLFAQALADEVHGSPLLHSIVILAPVHDGERTGIELGRHAQKRANPHPEEGSRTALRDRHGDTRYVPHPDRSRQGAAKSMKVADLAGSVFFLCLPQKEPQAMSEMQKGKES